MPTDEKLQQRGCYISSMCSLCLSNVENSFHLFFECKFVFMIWCWFASILDSTLHFQSIEEIWTIYDRGWSPQCKTVIHATIVTSLAQFGTQGTNADFKTLNLIGIQSAVNLSGNNTSKVSNSSVRDLVTLKKFDVIIHPPKPVSIELFGLLPTQNGLSVTLMKHLIQVPQLVEEFLGIAMQICFLVLLKILEVHAELSVMRATEIAFQRNWKNMWVESDSSLVVMAFNNDSMIPCDLRNRWLNCKNLLYHIKCFEVAALCCTSFWFKKKIKNR